VAHWALIQERTKAARTLLTVLDNCIQRLRGIHLVEPTNNICGMPDHTPTTCTWSSHAGFPQRLCSK
jgi:hypothetical protein